MNLFDGRLGPRPRAPAEHPPGTIRWIDKEGAHVYSPHSPMYSTALFYATEVWDSAANVWRPIYTESGSEPDLLENKTP
jgi:hypothetical protein